MAPSVVTFDAAGTLVRVRWTPGGFALDCARAVGLELGDEERGVFERSLRSRWAQYRAINETRDAAQGDAFWRELTQDWLIAVGHPASLVDPMVAAAPQILYGEGSTMFELFEDVTATLDALDARGIRIGVISNWDYSLHRVMRFLGITDRFEHVVASLEEGVEKPETRLFELTLERFGVGPADAAHVGDDPLDDLRGAQDAGMRALLIDRRHPETRLPILATLTDLPGALGLED